MILYLKTEIAVNDKDPMRCAHSCQHARKVSGNYRCLLYEENIDLLDDDEIGYGFMRTVGCREHVIGQPHLGNFAGDL